MPDRRERRREYDERRGSARDRGYDHRWDVAALQYRREHPLCLGCEAMGLVRPSEAVDHIVPVRWDESGRWDRDNWQACCDWHHTAVKQRIERMVDAGSLPREALRLDHPRAVALAIEAGGPPPRG